MREYSSLCIIGGCFDKISSAHACTYSQSRCCTRAHASTSAYCCSGNRPQAQFSANWRCDSYAHPNSSPRTSPSPHPGLFSRPCCSGIQKQTCARARTCFRTRTRTYTHA